MPIYKNNFSLSLLNSRDVQFENIDDTFYLNHGDTYKICLRNNSFNQKANANIFIDGKSIGMFRLNNNDKIIIERPAESAKKLTFYDAESVQGAMSRLDINSPDIGCLKVVIDVESRALPLRVGRPTGYSYDYPDCLSSKIGGTGLSGSSSQRFVAAEDIVTSERVVILAKMRLKEPIFSLDAPTRCAGQCDGELKSYKDMVSRLEKTINEKDQKISQLEDSLKSERHHRNEFIRQLDSLINIESL